MKSNREVFLKMSEEHYMDIPSLTREMFLTSKIVSITSENWKENMKDVLFEMLYERKKKVTKQLEDRQQQLSDLRIIKNK
jgi:hypothetical protein